MEIVVILNNIRSSENVGSIFRTADAVGVKKIILCGYTPAPTDRFGRENKGLTKASLGAEKFVKWEHTESLKETIKKLRNYFSGHSQKCTDIFLLKNSSCSPQSGSQGISDNAHSNNCVFTVIGIEQNKKAIDYRKIKQQVASSQHLALVFGNEVEGLSKEDLKLCDVVAELPMLGQKESLNVAVCAGVVLYDLVSDSVNN
jgi:tRNA G18 (ribose-2'-O)-methylase SpoU